MTSEPGVPGADDGRLARPVQAPPLDALSRRRQFTPEALRHLLELKDQLMFGQALALAEWRERSDRTGALFAETRRLELKVLELADALGILQRRLAFIPPAERVRFRPEGRFDVVLHARTYGLTRQEVSQRFLVDEITVGRWQQAATADPATGTVGSLLKAEPPIRAVADVVRETVAQLDRMKVGGSRKIADFLARSGIRIGRETVRRIRKSPPPPRDAEEGGHERGGDAGDGAPTSTSRTTKPAAAVRSIRARAPNHVWMSDITTVASFFGLWSLKVVAVLDVFSRFPLAFRVFWKEPTAIEVRDVVRSAIARFGTPRHFVTDQGSQFTAEEFRDDLRERGIRHRFGAIGKSGSIAVIERLWRSMKESLGIGVVFEPISQSHLTERLELFFFHYAAIRPHQGFRGATPAERYFGIEPATARAEPAPRRRGREPDPPEPAPLRVVYLDAARRLPVVLRNERPAKLAA